jgi:hypothetical protein
VKHLVAFASARQRCPSGKRLRLLASRSVRFGRADAQGFFEDVALALQISDLLAQAPQLALLSGFGGECFRFTRR